MGYALRSGIYFCIAHGRATFLDTIADRYFCLPPAIDRAFQMYLNAPRSPLLEGNLTPLVKQGLLLDSDADTLSAALTQYPVPGRELSIFRTPPVKVLTVGEAAIDRHLAARSVHRRSLHKLLQTCRLQTANAKNRILPSLTDTLCADLYAFQLSARFVTSFNQCLSSSIALTRFLSRRRIYPHLVLGVRMAPFAAHAWVQADDLVLNDTVDMVSRYTPILVI